MNTNVALNHDLHYISTQGVVSQTFYREVLKRGYKCSRAESYHTTVPLETTVGNFPVTFKSFDRDSGTFLIDLADALAVVAKSNEKTYCTVASNDLELVMGMLKQFKENSPPPQIEKNSVPVEFWFLTKNGPTSRTRQIHVPKWDEIHSNYPERTRDHLAQVFGLKAPDGGKLILWHGVPGTGKTYAIRGLINEWQSWCTPHYIVDPEEFMGDSSYLINVLLDADTDEYWRLIIFEDTGELLSPDAKTRTGQGLSRLLNVADGLIGQGLHLLFLITTNEKRSDLHPAVSREGRCLANIEFDTFTPHEAAQWIKDRGGDPVKSPATLAELYDVCRSQHINTGPLSLGPGQYL